MSEAAEAVVETTAIEADGAAEQTDVVENTAEATPEETTLRKFKVKVDGEELEVDEDELLKGYQSSKSAQKKFSEAAMMRKQAEKFVELLKTDPVKVLTDPDIGVNFRELAEKYLVEQLQEELLTPEEREVREVKRKLREYEDKERLTREEQEKAQYEELLNHYQQDFTKQITTALESTGLPQNEATIGRMANYYYQILQSKDIADEVKDNITFTDVAQLVQEDYQNELKRLVSSSNMETLVKLMGEDQVKNIRKWDLERVGKKDAPKTPEKQPDLKQRSSEGKKKMSMKEFDEQMAKIKRGG